jgi:hypothetical protein
MRGEVEGWGHTFVLPRKRGPLRQNTRILIRRLCCGDVYK